MCILKVSISAETKPLIKDEDGVAAVEGFSYSSVVGMLLYLSGHTRPDIAYAVNRLATRCAGKGPTTKDFKAIKRVIRYLKTTAHLELVYAAGSSATADAIFTLYAWSDAAYLTHKDSKSHSGTCFAYGDEPTGKFYAASQKQKTTTLSSTESETYAATEAAKDIIFFRNVLAELGFPQFHPTPLYIDNKSTITLGSNFSGNHKRVRHYMARINFLLELVDKKQVH